MGSDKRQFLGQYSFSSLRGRYLIAAAILTLVVLATTWVVHFLVNSAQQASARDIEARNESLQYSRLIKNSVWEANAALQSYLLSPRSNARHTVHTNLQAAIKQIEQLLKSEWMKQSGQESSMQALLSDLVRLNKQSGSLMDTRTDADEMYPAMKIARDSMLRIATEFQTAATLGRDEARNKDDNWFYPEVSTEFTDTMNNWMRMLSSYRMYLVTRFGNLSEDTLSSQAGDIDLIFESIRMHIDKLAGYKKKGMLGFQGESSLEQMNKLANEWHREFKRVVAINQTDRWRTDIVLMKQVIHPLFRDVWNRLISLDIRIEKNSVDNVLTLGNVAKSTINTLWLLALFAMVFIIAGYIYFDRTVLSPIAMVARALKNEASGEASVSLPTVTTDETQTLVSAFADMRKQVHYRQVQLEYQATHDELTGLPNRNFMHNLLQNAIIKAEDEGKPLALLIMDLDRFKEINDTLGHQTGDSILKLISVRLVETLGTADKIARLGGDEYAILLMDHSENAAVNVAKDILKSLTKSVEIDGINHYVGGSIGIAMFPEHGRDASTIIRRADVAMYVAKRMNKEYAIYDYTLDKHSIDRLALVNDLKDAIANDELELYYQPKINVTSETLSGVEALLRWQHPEQGFVPPDEIVNLAENTGLIRPLTHWVLKKAFHQCSRWHQQGHSFNVAVNLSVWNLMDPELVVSVRNNLIESGLPACAVILEITESAMMSDPEHALHVLSTLNDMGTKLAIDDFGTGYSSLAYIKRLPVNELKIDKSFVMEMTKDENDSAIVRSTIDLAHNLGLKIVAEGVETRDAWNQLAAMGCDTAQGYYISRPQSVPDFEGWLNDSDWCEKPRRSTTSSKIHKI